MAPSFIDAWKVKDYGDYVIGAYYHCQQYFRHIVSQIYWWRKLDFPEKSIDQLEVTNKFHHKTLYRIHIIMTGN